MQRKFFTFLSYRLTRFLYFFLTTTISPIIFFRLLLRLRKNQNFFSEMLNKFFGILIEIESIKAYKKSKKRIWIHAVSVGETHAAIPLMR